MIQVVEQTREEKIAMYMKLSKRELAELIVNCNELLINKPTNFVTLDPRWNSKSATYNSVWEWVQPSDTWKQSK